MLLNGVIRFSTQLKCYFVLILWIFLLIGGMYKYVGNLSNNSIGENGYLQATNDIDEDLHRFEQFKDRCGSVDENPSKKEDGGTLEGWKLQGVLLVIRHGDRGPMSHVQGVSSIDCGVDPVTFYSKSRYKNFLSNSTNPGGTNHMFWNKLGPFHGFPLLPPTQRSCLLGQLTYKGIGQLLQVGDLLNQVYARSLGVFNRYSSVSRSYPDSTLNSDEIVIYTTRYRRTFQSAMALLFPFLPLDKWLALNIQESHSMAFCFADCACSQADNLRKKLTSQANKKLSQHPGIYEVTQWIGSTVLQNPSNGLSGPNEVVDAILTIICHDAHCHVEHIQEIILETMSLQKAVPKEELTALPTSETEQLNILQEGCVEANHIESLMSYTTQESAKEASLPEYKRIGLLRAYGMIRNIVSYMLRMISGDRTKFVLYSGHDWTMQYLTAALGIDRKYTHVPYASRLGFEVYKSEANTDYYFRVIFSGKDVTQSIGFCEGSKSLMVNRDSRGSKAALCPIENIIRFLHEDYFIQLNVTNFKDACLMTPTKFNEI
uniref:2-phosphoxylose phosphatase 1 n=1 Tax=Megaselia scalaris TaxID=36166 RepID=T1GCT1_MEGSC